jgi:phosphomannomutase
MASISFYVGFYHLLIYLRRWQHREDLTFALTCLATGLYDVFCIGLYNAASVAEGAGLQCTGKNMLDGFKFIMEDGGWLLVRFSGTEPIVRVYTETTRPDKVKAILDDGLALAGLRA